MKIIPALRIENLSFKFNRKNEYFFYNVSLTFNKNKIHFLRGKNGSGKSTFFRILRGTIHENEYITGSLDLENNHYEFDNDEWHIIDKSCTSQIKMVQQNFDQMIADQFTFKQNLQLANLLEYPNLSMLPSHKTIPDFINRFDIDFNQKAYLLSGGQRQILAILMALQKPTKILLLDEPTAALDEKNALMVMDFLKNLLSFTKLTILVICHDQDMVKTYANDTFFEIEANKQSGVRTIREQSLS